MSSKHRVWRALSLSVRCVYEVFKVHIKSLPNHYFIERMGSMT